MELTTEELAHYESDPLRDDWLRLKFGIPADRYYSVRTWPPPHVITIDMSRTRILPKNKISKSDQP